LALVNVGEIYITGPDNNTALEVTATILYQPEVASKKIQLDQHFAHYKDFLGGPIRAVAMTPLQIHNSSSEPKNSHESLVKLHRVFLDDTPQKITAQNSH
jgi:hypothetical protein